MPVAFRRPRANLSLGIALIVLSGLLFASLDNTTRHLGATLPVLLMLWFRYAFQALAMAIWLAISRRRAAGAGFAVKQPLFQAIRGALLLATSGFSFFGLQSIPAAEFTAINMLTPVFVTLLAAWLLHERVSALRWAMVFGGFTGALIVMRPGSGAFGWAVLFPLAAACTYAAFQVLTSKLAGMESPYTTHFYTGLVGTLLATPLLWFSPVDVLATLRGASAVEVLQLAGLGLFGTAGHLLLILALGLAPASRLMPFAYCQIASAAAIGWLVFGYLPDRWAWIGMAVVAVCGGASAWLNVREAAARARPPSPTTLDATAD